MIVGDWPDEPRRHAERFIQRLTEELPVEVRVQAQSTRDDAEYFMRGVDDVALDVSIRWAPWSPDAQKREFALSSRVARREWERSAFLVPIVERFLDRATREIRRVYSVVERLRWAHAFFLICSAAGAQARLERAFAERNGPRPGEPWGENVVWGEHSHRSVEEFADWLIGEQERITALYRELVAPSTPRRPAPRHR